MFPLQARKEKNKYLPYYSVSQENLWKIFSKYLFLVSKQDRFLAICVKFVNFLASMLLKIQTIMNLKISKRRIGVYKVVSVSPYNKSLEFRAISITVVAKF